MVGRTHVRPSTCARVYVHTWVRTRVHTRVRTRVRTGVPGGPATDSRTQGTSGDRHGVMQALVRIQAYMLADIVVAIPAVDLAVEAVV
jgi:hypothetical protein